MNSKLQAIFRAGVICTILGTTSLTAFYGWYKAVSIQKAEASISKIRFSQGFDPDEIAVDQKNIGDILKQAEVFEFSRSLVFSDTGELPIEIRLTPTLYPKEQDSTNISEKDKTPDSLSTTPAKPQDPNVKTVSLTQGAITTMLIDSGIDSKDTWKIVDAMKPVQSPNKIPAGKEFQLIWKNEPSSDGKQKRVFSTMKFSIDAKTNISIVHQDDGSFKAEKIERPTITRILRGDATIDSTLFEAGQKARIPQATLSKLLRTFSWDIDFEREVKSGDKFSVLYQCEFDQQTGARLDCNDILYATMVIGNKKKSLYSFTHKDGRTKFYSAKGFSARKLFMKTPISMSRARISSQYGYRKHPVLGYSKMHSGTDFAAPRGTPIYAAADGKITVRSRRGAAGNMIEIVHGKYKTRYLHMSRFAKGQRVGGRVKQGSVIGYVGTTGRSTGPHLHYEVRLASNNKALNPLKISPVSSDGLAAKESKKFQTQRANLEKMYASTKANYIPDAQTIKLAASQLSQKAAIKTSTNQTKDSNKDEPPNEIPMSEVTVKSRPS